MIDLVKINVLIGSILLMLTFTNCKKSPDAVPNMYEHFLEFKDKNGQNLLNDFDINKLKTDVIVSTEKGETVNTVYSVFEMNNKKFLKINSSTLPNDKVNVLIYTIQNEELMGDSEKHILKTNWNVSNNRITLTDLFKDGEKQVSIKEDVVNFSHYVLIKE
ncbi:hypothetical protein [Sphingobacterium yanglingense]|uniref:Uncharacterized protein n=1 Tax=Sphingobacterium yanglingense TaxID=1437280 RepID=A0A4R6WPR3_9SPHI|nr:hypothetical protein [Sphingobacterium yanglingense]TDQ80151.1 hypothetical protein CLV99_1606 [Sphingobacterium yanglingense]